MRPMKGPRIDDLEAKIVQQGAGDMSGKPRSLASIRRRNGPSRHGKNPIRREHFGVLLATRNEILREGLRSMIAQCGFRVFACQATDRGFVFDDPAVQKCRIYVIDGSDDVDFSRTKSFVAQIRERSAQGHIVVLIPPHLAHAPDPAIVAEASAIVTTDVTAYVLGNLLQLVSQNYVIRSGQVRSDQVRSGQVQSDQVRSGQVTVTPESGRAPVINGAAVPHRPDPRPLIDDRTVMGLSSREGEILLHVIRGSSNKVIARALGIAEATVKIHVKGIFRKIGVANRTQAAFYVFNQGWLGGDAAGPINAVAPPPRTTNCFPTGLDIIVPRTALR